jgi:hypothetical protein
MSEKGNHLYIYTSFLQEEPAQFHMTFSYCNTSTANIDIFHLSDMV